MKLFSDPFTIPLKLNHHLPAIFCEVMQVLKIVFLDVVEDIVDEDTKEEDFERDNQVLDLFITRTKTGGPRSDSR